MDEQRLRVDDDGQLADALDDVLVQHGHVDHTEARVGLGGFVVDRFNGGRQHVCRAVADDVGADLNIALIGSAHQRGELVLRVVAVTDGVGIVAVGLEQRRGAAAEVAVDKQLIEAVLDHLVAKARADIAAGHLVVADINAGRQPAVIAQVLIKARLLEEIAELSLNGVNARNAVGIGTVQRLDHGGLELLVAQVDAVCDGIDQRGGLTLLHTAG